MNILMMAAGTGGHVFPALAVADELKARGATIHWLGTPSGMENELVGKHGYQMHHVQMQGMRRNGLARLIKLPVMLLRAVLRAKKIIQENKIDVVVGFGGYIAAPGGIAAKLCKKPLIIHEQNAIVGMSNKYLAGYADKVLQAFDGAFKQEQGDRFLTVGNPVRKSITAIDPPELRYQDDDQSTLKVLVVGGSLGASAINQAVVDMFCHIKRPLTVRHQCGKDNHESMLVAYSQANLDINKHLVELHAFIDDMDKAYAWADVIVCRAGALTVAEIQNVGLAAIFIPLPHAVDDHQTANAQVLVQKEAAILMPQEQLSGSNLAQALDGLDRAKCKQMAILARHQAQENSTENIAQLIENFKNN